MRRSVPLLLAVLFLAAGCGTAAAPAPPAAPAAADPAAETDPVGWTERVCEAMAPFLEDRASQDPVGPDPAAAVAALEERSRTTAAALDETLTALDAVGPSPVADGDAFVEELSRFLGDLRDVFTRAGDAAAGIDPAAPDAREQVSDALQPLTEVPTPDGRRFGEDSEVITLMGRSPRCQELGGPFVE